jgi:hypothetical protein
MNNMFYINFVSLGVVSHMNFRFAPSFPSVIGTFPLANVLLLIDSQEFLGDILLYDGHLVHLLQPLLLLLHLLMFPEMLNVFRVVQVFQLGVFVVVFLPMMNLIFVFVVAVVARTRAHVRKSLALDVDVVEPFVAADDAVAIRVHELEKLAQNIVATFPGDLPVGLIHEAVGAEQLFAFPVAVAVVVVESEKGGCVPAIDVMLLCA